MQQLSFLEIPPSDEGAPAVWSTLDEEQRAAVVAKLARIIGQTITPTPGEHSDERTEQDHL
jgi:hypothetical protein